MFYTVYKVTHLPSGRFYIGMHRTHDLQDRYLGSGKIVRAIVKKYGSSSLVKEILYVFDTPEEMVAKEIEILSPEILADPKILNLKRGGSGGFDLLNRKGSLKFHGKTHDLETKARIGLSLKGRRRPDISEALRRAYSTDPERREASRRGGSSNKGMPKCESHKDKISASLKKHHLENPVSSSMERAREVKAVTPLSEESRKRMSDSAKRRHKRERESRE